MEERPSDEQALTPAEADEEREARRRGDPYLAFRDARGHRRLVFLVAGTRMTIGRSLYSDLTLNWDPEVSTVHAELENLADDWFLVDDGMSRNGSFVNGQRLQGRRRLLTGDKLRFGSTRVEFHAPYRGDDETMTALDVPGDPGSG